MSSRADSGPDVGDDDRLLAVERADAFLPDVGGQAEHHAGLELLLGRGVAGARASRAAGRSRGRARGPPASGGAGHAGRVVGVEQAGRAAHRPGRRRGAGPTARPSAASNGPIDRARSRRRHGSGRARRRSRRGSPRPRRRPGRPRRPAVSRLERATGALREVIQATSWSVGVVTPAAAMASMNTPVSCRSVTPTAQRALPRRPARPRRAAPRRGSPRPPPAS